MGKNYYQILGIDPASTPEEFTKAYKELALKWHPVKHADGEDREVAKERFQEIAEAFDVLRTPDARAFYDQFGEEGLKRSAELFTIADPDLLFKEYFGSDNPFRQKFDAMKLAQKETGEDVVHSMNHPVTKSPTVELDLPCTLEELFKGCTKKIPYTRDMFLSDGVRLEPSTTVFTIEVLPGWPVGSTVTFKEQGAQGPSIIPADVVYTVTCEDHPFFTREGDNLVHTHVVSLKQALTGTTVLVKTLDDRTLRIPINEVVHPTYEKRVEGEGMPRVGKEGRGDLLLRFNTVFPRKLSKKQADAIEEHF